MKKYLLFFSSILVTFSIFAQVPSYVPTNGLVGWWPFTGNANDISGNGNNGTVNGAVLTTDVAGNPNSAYHFNGSNQFIQVPNSASLVFGLNEMSVSLWVNIEGYSGNPTYNKIAIAKQSGDGTTQSGYNLSYKSGSHGLLVKNGAGGSFGSAGVNTQAPLFQWIHCVYTWNGTIGNLYSDGVLINSSGGQTASIGANTMPLLFGKPNWVNVNSEHFFGKMDDIGIWNRVLTPCEVTNLYQSQLNSLSINAGNDQTICHSQSISLIGNGASSYSWNNGVTNNVTFTPPVGSTTYTVTGTDGAGCTGQDQVTILVNPNTASVINQVDCNSYTAPDGQVYNTSGNYTAIIPNSNGCDSIININLTINNSTSSSTAITTCDTYTAPDGQVYNSNGTYIAVIPNSVGCDSTITIDLTITNSNSGTDVISACNSYTWIDGNTYSNSNNTATYILTNNNGCDSVVTLNLTLNNSNSGINVISACDSYTWIDGNTYTSSNNTATWTLTNSAGCDSLVTLDLTMNNSTSSTLNESGLDTYTLNAQTYNQSGVYTQVITNSAGCDSTITLNLALDFTGIIESESHFVQVYPNPTNSFLIIESLNELDIQIEDFLGKVLICQKIKAGKETLNLQYLPSGIYIISSNKGWHKTIIKE